MNINTSRVIFCILFILILFSISISGCLKPDTINPLSKNISEIIPSSDNVPMPEDHKNYRQMNYSVRGYTENELLNESDLICYATAAEIFPSYWNTPDGNPPLNAEGYVTILDYSIYTDIDFETTYVVKGDSAEHINVRVSSGEVDGFVVYCYGLLSPWDFEENSNYLLCLSKTESGDQYYILKAYHVND
ncbi:hypothetical protein MmiHf6_16310 [Methanimicrococcus hongohii]|uniref:Uncharacterized protein n=1 Tax=Methanimicrococcus hongohii TaxID=3028295 RepID=A0AA96V2S9_9EURY|nr:hypothetical protein [Methanimicrococcus sp. Hf6]WNY24300.1 hypothetical protein MmiHf6_16310 [Methanimicrococcus sp. Hf6]